MSVPDFDVVVAGSGLVGSSIATILRKLGHSVCMIERSAHPRFAIGEAMQQLGTLWMWMMGQHYGVDELVQLADPRKSTPSLATACGVKRSFGFAYHEDGQPQRPEHGRQALPSALPFIRESHFLRERVDSFMVDAAVRHGVEYRDRTDIADIDIRDDAVEVALADGRRLTARFYVDCTGPRSRLVEKLGIREQPTRLATKTRSIFSHFRNVRPYDVVGPAFDQSRPVFEGTMHHVFDGGWFWVIPFDNVEGNVNLCSIGLTLDMDKHPPGRLGAREEFERFVRRFPSVERHFEGAEAIRPFVATGRLQHSCTRSAGPRWALVSHTYGFVDPLFSTGLIASFSHGQALIDRLHQALTDDCFTDDHFAPLDDVARKIERSDAFIAGTYRSMSHPSLFNARIQLWTALGLMQDLWAIRNALKYLGTRDRAFLVAMHDASVYHDLIGPLIRHADDVLDQVERGDLDAERGARAIYARLGDADCLPHHIHPFGSAEVRGIDLSVDKLLALIRWVQRKSPEPMRSRMFDLELTPMLSAMLAMGNQAAARVQTRHT